MPALAEKPAEDTVLAQGREDVLLGRFKKVTRKLARLAMELEADKEYRGADGIMDVIAHLKEVQTECEESKAITRGRRREYLRSYRAARQATKAKPETGSITEDEADTTEGT